jgi:hypothetical protein
MGCFPYTCKKCGGADKRCGTKHEPYELGCDGGQFCWEDTVVVTVNGIHYRGTYTGYGSAHLTISPNIEVHSREFEEYFKGWGTVMYACDAITCASCFDNEICDVPDHIVRDMRYTPQS